MEQRVRWLVQSFTDEFKALDKTYNSFKEYIGFEFEVQEAIKLGLEKIIQKKDEEIKQLQDILSLPRKHYKFIDNLTIEKVIEQKNQIL